MQEVLLLYLFTRLDAVNVLLGVGIFAFGVVAWVALLAYADGYDWGLLWMKRSIVVFVVCVVAFVLTPSQKDAAIIVGGAIAIHAAKSEKGKEMGQAVYDAIMRELKPREKK